ncbi:GTP-binding protein [Limosilactobacillus sp.]|uniref:GTP-binding protein n=1 Tax=Limosilactobacillus sp. TaxID=2773925 RepID=UPI00345EF827
MKKIVAGIIAPVDAGKTTLSEAMLYQSGAIRQLGRVDRGNAHLDPDQEEKRRGITIFSHQAQLQTQDLQLTLLDTPGHVDFAAQTEDVLRVLDYAVLLVSATDGVTGYTRTLWRLLDRYQVPTMIFVNKCDGLGADYQGTLDQLQDLAGGCLAFDQGLTDELKEQVAMQDDDVLAAYLDSGQLGDDQVRAMIRQRLLFPVYHGSALQGEGVAQLLAGLSHWTVARSWSNDFAARVFRISHDSQGNRLTWLRVLGGQLKAKQELVDGEKADQVRIYDGGHFDISQEIPAGGCCAVTGLSQTFPGQGLGNAHDSGRPFFQPVMSYTVVSGNDNVQQCLNALKRLADEDPLLDVIWNQELQEIRVQVMGQVQLEVLQQRLHDEAQIDVHFTSGSILYKETITQPVEGVGHFEPLRHYAEVHLLMEPAKRGSGLHYEAHLSGDVLDLSWQHQILVALRSKQHRGVLIGAPLTDVKMTLVAGKGNIVHTVGGDFREAAWRAVRQGLMELRRVGACQLLEPWYSFRLTLDQQSVGHALTDIQRMGGQVDAPQQQGSQTVITGTAPVSAMRDYAQQVRSYTHGQGQLECVVDGYRPCHDAKQVIEQADYDPVSDLPNTPGSVFCAHGAGYPVHWDDVPAHMHVPYASSVMKNH